MKSSCRLPLARATGFLLALSICVLDQWSKGFLLMNSLINPTLFPLEITSFFNLTLVFNTGVSFGMFARMQAWMPLALTIGTTIVLLALIFWLLRARDKYTRLALPFIIGGAAGNIIDRARAGAVTDFLDFHIGRWHWPAFNIADSAIFIGVVILVLISIVGRDPAYDAKA